MKGKVVCITGGSGTLGSAISIGLAKAGAIVFLLDRNIEKASQLALDGQKEGLDIRFVACEVLDAKRMNDAVEEVLAEAKKIDVWINGAGGNMPGATIGPDQSVFDLEMDAFRKVTDLNLMGTVIPTVAVAKAMVAQKKGCIINISSMAAILPLTRVVGYSASKSAIDSFTRSMAVEFASKYGEGIRVNAIAPGFLVASQNRDLLLNQDGSLTARGETIISQTPMKRFGRPEELVSTIKWLADDASSFITGIVVPIDGGFSAFSGV